MALWIDKQNWQRQNRLRKKKEKRLKVNGRGHITNDATEIKDRT